MFVTCKKRPRLLFNSFRNELDRERVARARTRMFGRAKGAYRVGKHTLQFFFQCLVGGASLKCKRCMRM